MVFEILRAAGRLFSQVPRKFTVCIEGNIGSGKTSFLNLFENNPLCQVVDEPVAKWRNVNGANLLEEMYRDPARWSFTLQTYVHLTMLQAHSGAQTKPVRLMERSIYSAKYCFLENLRRNKMMTEMEYNILVKWFDWIVHSDFVKTDLIVYLRTCPEVLHERISKRGRNEELSIPIEYLRSLHEFHEDWLIHRKFPVAAPVLVMDANLPLDQMQKQVIRHHNQILFGMNV